jgi:hypothetical protein
VSRSPLSANWCLIAMMNAYIGKGFYEQMFVFVDKALFNAQEKKTRPRSLWGQPSN